VSRQNAAVVQSGNVLINEFTPGSSGKIELYNAGDTPADLSNWSVDDIAAGGYAPKSLGAAVILPAGGFLLVGYAGVNTSSADSVRLVDANGVEVDSHNNFYTGSSNAGLCFGRRPNGGAWATASIPCSLGASNGCGASGACDDGNACTSGESIQADCSCGGGSPVGCDDGNPCTADQCDALSGCGHVNLADGSACPAGTCQSGSCVALPSPSPGNDAAITTMARRDRIRLQGKVVAPAGAFDGEVLIENDTLTCVAVSCADQPGAADATVVQTNGVILPGLIDAHNHILFDIFDESDWSPAKIYTNHNQWPNDARYGAMVDAKQYLNGEGSTVNVGCEMLKYGELKGLIAGTTSIQGSANPANKVCYGSLARTIDQTANDLPADKMQTATIFPSTSAADGVCNNIASGATNAYVIHVGEGVDASALSEFSKLGTISTTDECLYVPQTTIIHGTAFGDHEFSVMAQHGMSLVWSPRSNVFLYGAGQDLTKTANVPLALSKGINVALAPDWSIGGSQNLLDELRFANDVDDTVWGNQLSAQKLMEMLTINAARALGVDAYVGSLEVGKRADVLVIGGDTNAPYDALLAATPSQVRLVFVNGVALYGDAQLQPLGAPTPGCEALDICGNSKFVCVAEAGGTASNKLGQSYAEITATLSSAMQSYDDLNLTQWNFAPIAPLVKCPASP
jgi:cytosine/adenosine deaminase-related metal-dependent hydrolase